MQTPIVDFLWEYSGKQTLRFHMPGHKGKSLLGIENWDITEVAGADSLYEAEGIIARSEANATGLFGSQASFYSTEGSSQCIRAMLHLLLSNRGERAPVILAARNAHKAFIYAAALLDFEIHWLWPEESSSVCSCIITAEKLERELAAMKVVPAAVYITSPDYLGNLADIKALADICHRYGTYLAVDNAHGAYLHFLREPQHPMDLGADICCDSAHKTLPVLTGGAYLHISRKLPADYVDKAKSALALFGSTSPSYLIMASLDACNPYLESAFSDELEAFIAKLNKVKEQLTEQAWAVENSDPLRLCLRTDGKLLAKLLREKGIEVEYADNDYIVFMLTPFNTDDELEALCNTLQAIQPMHHDIPHLELPVSEQAVSVREAIFSPSEVICVDDALDRICASPLVSCPPAVPIVVSGEEISSAAIKLLKYYNIDKIEVSKVPGA